MGMAKPTPEEAPLPAKVVFDMVSVKWQQGRVLMHTDTWQSTTQVQDAQQVQHARGSKTYLKPQIPGIEGLK